MTSTTGLAVQTDAGVDYLLEDGFLTRRPGVHRPAGPAERDAIMPSFTPVPLVGRSEMQLGEPVAFTVVVDGEQVKQISAPVTSITPR